MASQNGTIEAARPVVSFAKLHAAMPMPNLLDVQTRSFGKLVDTERSEAETWGFCLDRVFEDIFPVTDVNGDLSLEYVACQLGEPKYSVEECIETRT